MPGLYRFNLFSRGLANWLGLHRLPEDIGVARLLGDGAVELVLGGSTEKGTDAAASQAQQVAIQWLGADKFFDIQEPDRKLDYPDWDKVQSVPWIASGSVPG